MSKKKMAVRRVAATTALGVGLVAGGAGLASATSTQSARDSTTPTSTSPPNRADMAGGVVTAVTDTSITVKHLDGTSTTYTITSTTALYEGPTTIAASSLALGQHVEIELSSANSTLAQSINVQAPVLFGTVTTVQGNTITISDLEGFSRTIVVDSSTTYTKSGAAATLGDVSVGTLISAEGTVDANLTSLDATSVSMGQPTSPAGGQGPGGPGFDGPGFGPPGGNGPPRARANRLRCANVPFSYLVLANLERDNWMGPSRHQHYRFIALVARPLRYRVARISGPRDREVTSLLGHGTERRSAAVHRTERTASFGGSPDIRRPGISSNHHG